jgi:hypothetical protein
MNLISSGLIFENTHVSADIDHPTMDSYQSTIKDNQLSQTSKIRPQRRCPSMLSSLIPQNSQSSSNQYPIIRKILSLMYATNRRLCVALVPLVLTLVGDKAFKALAARLRLLGGVLFAGNWGCPDAGGADYQSPNAEIFAVLQVLQSSSFFFKIIGRQGNVMIPGSYGRGRSRKTGRGSSKRYGSLSPYSRRKKLPQFVS